MSDMPDQLKDLIGGLDDDEFSLSITDEDMALFDAKSDFESIFKRSRKKVSEDNEEVLVLEDLNNFSNSVSKSIEDIENKALDIKEAVESGNSKKIEDKINIFNRSVHGLKGQVFSNSALTIGDILHGIEDITTQNIMSTNDFDLSKLYDFISSKINEIKEYVLAIKDGTYETIVNKNKKFIPEENKDKIKNLLDSIKNDEDDSSIDNSEIEIILASKNNKIDKLIRLIKDSRLKQFLIETQKEINAFILNFDFNDETKQEYIKKEKRNILDRISVFKDMFEISMSGNSNYYDLALKNSKNENIQKKKNAADSVNMNIDTLNNILEKLNDSKIENTQVKNTIKVSEGNIRSGTKLLDSLDKMLNFFETFSNSKIQSLSNEEKMDSEMFDPLEMDNYTELQEKTKSMKEMLVDLRNIFSNEEKNIDINKNANKLMESALQKTNESLMSTRLKTVKSYLKHTLVSAVSSAAKDLGKDVTLEITGDHIEVDSVIMEKLKSSLTHTLKNSVAHGIESKQERIRSGKNPIGKITCDFEQKNGRLNIIITDDGAGINVRKIEKKAIEKGIWNENNRMTELQAVDVICMPNFSTQDTADQVSGRGVGMDAVKNEVIKLNGRYDIISKEGKGLNITIQIPTSLSNKDVIIVSCGKQKFAIPLEICADTSIMEPNKLRECAKKGNIDFKGKTIDFRYLSDLVGIGTDETDKSECNYVMLLSDTGVADSGVKIVVAVEKITKEMVTQVPIKTIGRTLSNIPGVVGTTVLSGGNAAFIYDPVRAKIALLKHYGLDKIIDDVSLPMNDKNHGKVESKSKGLVMIVDDSITVRKSTVRFLEKNGYNHITATDGENAKEKIMNVMPDLILLDVEMPKMDGFEFATFIKGHEQYKHIPIIMITSRTADKHRNKAAKIGVEDYIGKPFTAEILLPAMRKLLKK